MLREADALVAYRTYPHVDMATTGERAAELLARRLQTGRKRHAARAPTAVPDPAERAEHLAGAGAQRCTTSSLRSTASTARCSASAWASRRRTSTSARRWSGATAKARSARSSALYERVAEPTQWRQDVLSARDAVAQAITLAADAAKPVVIADTQDNPGAGGDSNTTGLLHALLLARRRAPLPGPGGARPAVRPEGRRTAAREAGVGAEIELALGTAVPTFSGQASDPPLRGRFKVVQVARRPLHADGPDDDRPDGAARRRAPAWRSTASASRWSAARSSCSTASCCAWSASTPSRCASSSSRAPTISAPTSSRIASHVLVAKAAGPMAADPGDLPWRHLPPSTRTRP